MHHLTHDTIAADMPAFALHCAREHLLERCGASQIFGVYQPWQQDFLPLHPHVHVADNAQALEAALEQSEKPLIFIPPHAALTPSLVRSILARSGSAKTILWGVIA